MSKTSRSPAQSWAAAGSPRPIVIIGGGSIVADAHLPAYRMAGLPVAGVFDLDAERTAKVAVDWDITPFASLEEAIATENAVFDLALPPVAHQGVIEKLPEGAPALLQKPMGRDLAEATAILKACRERKLTAAVNFQLRFSPMMLAIHDLYKSGALGELVDVELHANIMTPWHLWPFLKGMERVEILLHSIHYLDLMRHFLGDPRGIHAKTLGHPDTTVSQSRTSAILDYPEPVRAVMSVNHNHDFGPKFQDCYFRFEGTKGVAITTLGVNLDYPKGVPDELWFCEKGGDWEEIPLSGTWFPHAFIGVMNNLQRFIAGKDDTLLTSVEDAWNTMALVEAAYESSARPATPIKEKP
ncbi:Gfo/Idh/MocA family protein [Martelella radicis]|uniref:Putative dehydrogenase n=1 Tax=Martelella radicis TaxID=1397476 RepID=A0A7W6PC54_9HYPH|nr:Gfo/Idh/MocA family oxidoreductase [Martelella radicis]MBB4123324.1 putative dehydrogenase [Martelella radicis]